MRLVKDLKQENLYVLDYEDKGMNIYTISSFSLGNGVIDFSDPKSRLSSFFIWNEGNGKFLLYSQPKGKIQSTMRRDKLRAPDYFPSNIGVPVFSQKAVSIFELRIASEMSFYKCTVENTHETIFLCKVNNYLPIIDEEKTTFRELIDGTKLIDIPTYKCDKDFFIARDSVFCEQMILSQQFVDLCNDEGLNIEFFNINE